MRPLPASARTLAILSVHSHGDRSFLDDRGLAVLSGELREAGFENDLVSAVLDGDLAEGTGSSPFDQLVKVLERYDVIAFERVWSRDVAFALRTALPQRVFVALQGEHVLEDPPADYVCRGELTLAVSRLLSYLRGEAQRPAAGTLVRTASGWEPIEGLPERCRPRAFAVNLRPIVVGASGSALSRTFSLLGNSGCPYQADARDNPVYAGVVLPEAMGKGCAFCTTGNRYEGRPVADTLSTVLEQARVLRREAPQIERLVLKDQNPFSYLDQLVEACAAEGLPPFTLLLETRADWFLRARARFERALGLSARAGYRISPYLVGIESFSQPELDRMNKGVSVETNVTFLEALWEWKERFGDVLDLESCSFGFVLFTPWTKIEDLEANLEGVRRTRLSQLRGRLLLSRARLYPDTALYYLAERDGLLTKRWARSADDPSARYGYYPGSPWRFADADVEHFASLASEASELSEGRDEVTLFECLLEAFRQAPTRQDVTLDAVLDRFRSRTGATVPAPAELRRRVVALLAPLEVEAGFGGGWRLGPLFFDASRLRVHFEHPTASPLVLELGPPGGGPRYARSRHYDISYANGELSDAQRHALVAVCDALRENDR